MMASSISGILYIIVGLIVLIGIAIVIYGTLSAIAKVKEGFASQPTVQPKVPSTTPSPSAVPKIRPATPTIPPAMITSKMPLVPTAIKASDTVLFYTKVQGALIAELPSGIYNKFSRPNDWEKLLNSTYIEIPTDLILNVSIETDGHLEENSYLNTVQGGFANQLQIVKFEIQRLPSQPVSNDFQKLTSILKPSKCQEVLPSTDVKDKFLIFNDIDQTSNINEPTKYCTDGVITDFSQFKDINKPRSMQIPKGTKVTLFYKNNTAKVIDSTQDPENIILKDMTAIQVSNLT
jgi:hypothetical protein